MPWWSCLGNVTGWPGTQWSLPTSAVRYHHVDGITRGMSVLWSVEASGSETRASIVHEWNGPPWPLIRRPAAEWVIGPVFIHGIASRTLEGIARYVEHRAI